MTFDGLRPIGKGRAWPVLALIPALALCGCVDARLSKPDVRLPSAFEAPAGAVDPALQPASLDRWWMLFGDPQLQQLIDQALVSAPDARTAMARLNEAVATRRERYDQALLPQGELKGSATDQHTEISGNTLAALGGGLGGAGAGGGFGGFSFPGDSRTLSASFNPTWEIDLFGRAQAAARYANADFAATRFDVEASRMSLAAQVAQSLFQARSLALQLADAREDARIRTDFSRIGRIRAERGLGSTADAARFQSDLDTAGAEVARLEAALTVAKRTLLVLLGRGTEPLDGLTIEAVAAAPPKVPVSTPGELLARRPDVREAEAHLREQAETLTLDRRALYPKFTLQPGGSISRSTGAADYTTTLWSLGLGASAPILDRPQLIAEMRAQQARGEQAVIAFEKAVQTAYGDASNALTTQAADETRNASLGAAETGAKFAFDAAQHGYQAGLTDMTTLLDAERAWRAARTALTAGRTQALEDAVATFKALGGGWTPPPIETAKR